MNQHRSAVYERRGRILNGDSNVVREELESLSTGDKETQGIIEEKKSSLGEDVFYASMKRLILQVIDMLWVEHLEVMDYMRSSVNLRAYGQRDPLIEYKKEGLRMFREMQDSVDEHILRLLQNIGEGAFARERQKVQEVHKNARLIGGNQNVQGSTSNTKGKKIGRNDPCHCGSGKKFKKCHGK